MTASSLKDRQLKRIKEALYNEDEKLSDWEESFLRSAQNQMIRYDRELSEKQEICLTNIENIIQNGRPKR